MKPVTIRREDPREENQTEDEDENNGPFSSEFQPHKLIEGISIKDLCDGNPITFEVNKDEINDDFKNELDDDFESNWNQNDILFDSELMRTARGAPPVYASFESLASKMVNLTEDGLVKKQIITHGTGKQVSNYAYVTVHYNFYKEHCSFPFDSTYLRNRPVNFRLDQGEIIPGFESAIKSMKKNENSQFLIKWEVAFGELGCPDRIEPKCDIFADVILLNFVEMNIDDINSSDGGIKKDFQESLIKAKQIHAKALDEFFKEDFRGARKSFQKTLDILNNLRLSNEEEESKMLHQKKKCLVNLASCLNKQSRFEEACLICREALTIDNNNVKAIFQYGRAKLALSDFENAKNYLLKANKLKPNDKEIHNELKKLDSKVALYELKEKDFCKKAFGYVETKKNDEKSNNKEGE